MRTAQPLADRIFDAITITDDGCWNWHSLDDKGYGRIWIGSRTDGTRRLRLAHRISYQTFAGEIPDGMQLDHLCRNPSCVNPDHLEPVWPAENVRRAPRQPSTLNAAKDECHRGHPFTLANTYINQGKRYCRACRHDKDRARSARASREHWLLFDQRRQVVGCHCGFRADLDADCGWGDSVVEHLLGVGR